MNPDLSGVEKKDGVAETRDGTRIGYTLYGRPGTTRRVALVHSLAMDRSFWQPAAERLAARASVLILDCRGHGASDKPDGPYTVELMADDLADVMAAVGWPSAVVAGASMGGCITLAFGAKYPHLADGLGLVDTTAWYGPTAPADWAGRAQKAKDEGLEALVQFQTTRWFTDAFREANPNVVKRCVDTFLANEVPAYEATCNMLGACDLRDSLPAFSAPTAVVVGREDYATPVAMAEYLHENIAGATLLVIEDGRHLTPLEHPARIAAEIGDLLDRIPA